MANQLPAFGDISGIESEQPSLRENLTLINEEGSGTVHAQVDSQETIFNDSQTQTHQEQIENSVDENDHNENDEDRNRMEVEDATAAGDVSKNITTTQSASNQHLAEKLPSDHSDVEDDLEESENEQIPEEKETETNEVDLDTGDSEGVVDVDDEPEEKVFQLPISKVKRIMKADPDINLFGKEAVAAIAICTESFVSMLAQQSYKLAVRTKKKRITLEHVKSIISSSSVCDFLEGTIPEFDI